MDDFGTVYSSLSYLRQLPIDSLKIDKSFTDEITDGHDNSTLLINTIIAMGKTLDLSVLAEGVEAAYQIEYLRSRGCDNYQGFFFSRPVSEDAFMKLPDKKNRELQ
jgi:sensor c-di-GMP phosphodiesterase-like protein